MASQLHHNILPWMTFKGQIKVFEFSTFKPSMLRPKCIIDPVVGHM